MLNATELHNQAMNFAEEAEFERAAGNREQAKELYAKAFELEKRAAKEFESRYDMEPTRSVLFRSAASLAMECGDVRLAEKMIAQGLAGEPPEEIANELRDLLEQVYFQRHLDVRGINLEPNELQISLTGNEIGFGIAKSDAVTKRIQDIERLLYRTAERKEERPFREHGPTPREITDNFSIYLSIPRAASYAVSFRVGQLKQKKLPGMDPSKEIIAELLDCINLIESKSEAELKLRIPDEKYRNHFLQLLKQIKPDGNRIKTVGFTASLGGREKRVLVTSDTGDSLSPEAKNRNAKQIPSDNNLSQNIEIQGLLRYADSTRQSSNKIRVIDKNGFTHKIEVPVELMDDVVRPHWDAEVKITGVHKKSTITLVSIESAVR